MTETLVYYDGVEVFAGQDPTGGHYIGMIINTIDEVDRYLVTGVSPERVRQFRSGVVDLRTLFLEAPNDEWFITRADGVPGQPLVLEPQSESLLSTELLPEEGFFLEDVPVDDLALQQARERGRVVFEFSVEPPETAAGHRIRMTTLAALLTHLQTIVRYAYRAAVRDLPNSARQQIDATDGHIMDVVEPATAGSFRVILEAANPPDLFGSGELVRGLRRMDKVFACADDPDAAQDLLQAHRGHLAGSFIKFVRFLADHQTGLRYGWADPAFLQVQHGGISQVLAHQLAESLSGITSLATETVTLVGDFVRVNLETGDWGLTTDDGRKIGKVGDNGPSLDGLITRKRYRFECVEDIGMDTAGREIHTLYLQKIEPA